MTTHILCARTGAHVAPADLWSPLREILEAEAAMMRRDPLLVYVGPAELLEPRGMLASRDGPEVVRGACSIWPASDVRDAAGWGPERLRGVDRPLTGIMGDDGEMVWFNWDEENRQAPW